MTQDRVLLVNHLKRRCILLLLGFSVLQMSLRFCWLMVPFDSSIIISLVYHEALLFGAHTLRIAVYLCHSFLSIICFYLLFVCFVPGAFICFLFVFVPGNLLYSEVDLIIIIANKDIATPISF